MLVFPSYNGFVGEIGVVDYGLFVYMQLESAEYTKCCFLDFIDLS